MARFAGAAAASAGPEEKIMPQPDDDRPIEVIETAAQPTAVVRFQVAPERISEKLAEVLPAVYGFLTEAGITPAGPPFSRYHHIGEDSIDMEAGMPTPEPVTGRGEIAAAELPGGAVATTWHVGPYDGLVAAHAALSDWAAAAARRAAGGAWESYVTDPGAEPDPSRWRTQLFLPLE